MNIDTWLTNATKKLQKEYIASARLDALILLEDTTSKDRSWLLAHPEFVMNNAAKEILDKQIERRMNHEPLAYIRGRSEFYGREFIISPATLQPRPETEIMLDLLKMQIAPVKTCTVIDVGTGSGAIAITAKLELPELDVIATEINQDALNIATKNAALHAADIMFYRGNLLEPVLGLKAIKADAIILANLPYVPDSHTINEAARHEPRLAIFGGKDGLDLYREMFSQISNNDNQVTTVMTESLPFQHDELARIANEAGFSLEKSEDFIQVFTRG